MVNADAATYQSRDLGKFIPIVYLIVTMVLFLFLRRVFGVDFLLVGMAEALTDSANPSASAREEIWGNHCWLGYINPMAGANPDTPTWAKEFYIALGGVEEYGGFAVFEHFEPRPSGLGILYEDAWKWKQDFLYAKQYGSLIVNPLTP